MSAADPLVIALGGNALSPDDGPGGLPEQFDRTRATAAILARTIRDAGPLLITHGNGPQVGAVLRRVELAAHEVYALPLDICVADTQGGMGYMIAQCLNNELRRQGIPRRASAMVTSVEVDADDPAYSNPTKPVGGFYTDEQARAFQTRYNWRMQKTSRGWRRLVASPRPISIPEIELIRRLAAQGDILVTCGGGGVPVIRDNGGDWTGAEAVIDKDRSSALLARCVGARVFLIATAVHYVQSGFETPDARDLLRLNDAEAEERLRSGEFPAGSMGPKVEAALDFVRGSAPGATAIICHLDSIAEALAGRSGTRITL